MMIVTTLTRPLGAQFATYNPVLNYGYPATNAVNIIITDGGSPTDADGLLTGQGLSKTGVGTYAMLPGVYYNLQYLVRACLSRPTRAKTPTPPSP